MEKVENAVKAIEGIKDSRADIYEDVGIILLELDDILKAQDSKQFLKEKKELRTALKSLTRQVSNLTFAKLKIAKREAEKN